MITHTQSAVFSWTLLLALWLGGPAFAQQFPGTKSVNDCTFLKDPDQTRRCVESYQGSAQTPVITSPDTMPGLIGIPQAAPPAARPATTAPPPRLSPAPPPRLAPP
jgi:hypothetical protein